MRSRTTSGALRRQCAVVAGMILLANSTTSVAATILEADLPDFYQHQNSGFQPFNPPDPQPNPLAPAYGNGDWWENGGGWCRTTAWVNSMYHWSQKGAAYTDLFDNAGRGGIHAAAGLTWVDRMVYTNEELATWNGTLQGCVTSQRIDSYVQAKAPMGNLSVYEVAMNGGTGNVDLTNISAGGVVTATGYTSLFDFYADYLPTDASLLVLVTNPPANLQTWWGNFHVVTGAGVDAATNRIYFADPDNSVHGGGWGFPYAGTDAFPVGQNYYASARVAADGFTFDSGPYEGATIAGFYMLVPEPSGLATLAIGVLLLVLRRFAGGR